MYVDNVYFYKAPAPPTPTAPTVAAPAPTAAAANVISLFSNAYTNVTVDTWSADWDQADVADVAIAGNDIKKLHEPRLRRHRVHVDAGQCVGDDDVPHGPLDARPRRPHRQSSSIKLVDFGANGVFGGGDDVEHELTFNRGTTPAVRDRQLDQHRHPALGVHRPHDAGHLAQLIISRRT